VTTSERIMNKLARSGVRGLLAAAMRHAAHTIDKQPSDKQPRDEQPSNQVIPHKTLSRYISFKGKHILEVGGAQSCDSAYPFLKDGAASAVVTGLDHISQERVDDEYDLRILRADALTLSSVFGPERFDVVYGISIVEHIPSPSKFLDEVYRILKPGGLAFLEGNPIWSSSKGHHLWVATWGGPYQSKTTSNYLFSGWPGKASTNPLPDWSHLLMTSSQMREYLTEKRIPSTDIDCIVDWVFHCDQVNRINMSEIAAAYTGSNLVVLEANTVKEYVPPDVLADLRGRFGDGVDYGTAGVSYVLAKRR